MNRTFFDWHLKSGEKIHSMIATPDGETKQVIVLVHGLGDHIRRYDEWTDRFLKEGTAIVASDQIGHGESEGNRGVIHGFDDFFEIINKGIITATLHFPNKPIFLFGHSMGGLEVLDYGLNQKPEIAGIIASAPSLKLPNVPKIQVSAVRLLKMISPKSAIKNGLILSGLSKDPAIVEHYKSDPLVHNRVSLRLALALYEEGVKVREHASELKLPILIVQGAKDILVDPDGSREFVKRAGQNVTYKEYPEGFHEMHNDVEANDYFERVQSWLKEHVS